ncbi:STAS domain-containing protein [Methanobrevibacter boviskoreani]|uniref:STAS domain-containing protein n=1 Tax=Methanobrevibacter boviskoreani TaxID=1348249 RepID=UPI0023F57936|nr:STAS domain-containing protein [Methanobrevibacter boviskoreani]MDD6257263.1 STAS domain-containing protein [Methanobrevibacter boviskoreani]
MDIEKNLDGEKLTVKIIGRLDTNTSPELTESLKEDLPDVKELILDLSDLLYISSAGLRVILSTQKTMNKQGSMVIRNVQDMVMEVFEATGFTDILTIE